MRKLLPSLLAALSQSVGLVGTLDICDEFNRNLGVKQPIPKLYQFFSVLGYSATTIGHIPLLSTGVGRVFFTFNAVSLGLYIYMTYLTLTYNRNLEAPSRFFEAQSKFATTRHRVNVPALSGWVTLNLLLLYIWINEGRKSLSARYKNEILASLGFLMQSIGNMRAGFNASMTSNAALTMASSNVLAGLSLLPLASTSPIARIYIAGYVSVLYNTLMNAYYALQKLSSSSIRSVTVIDTECKPFE